MKQKAQQYCSFLCRLPIERCTCQAQYRLRDVGKAPGGNLADLIAEACLMVIVPSIAIIVGTLAAVSFVNILAAIW